MSRRRASGPGAAPVLVVAAAALWGTTGTAQSLGGTDAPVAVGAARLAVGGGALVLVALGSGGASALLACLRRPLLSWTVLAAVATAVYQGAFFSAVASTGVATGTVVALGTAPVATGLCGAVLFGERLTRWWALATVLAVGGCGVLVAAGDDGATRVAPVGVALAVLAGGCYGLYTAAAKALLERGVPVVVAMGVTLGAGGLLLAPVLAVSADDLVGGRSLVVLAWLGLVTTGVAYVLYARGLHRLPASTVGTLSLAEPLTATALGLLVLGERLTPGAAAGAAVLVAGLVIAALRPVQPVLEVHLAPPGDHVGEQVAVEGGVLRQHQRQVERALGGHQGLDPHLAGRHLRPLPGRRQAVVGVGAALTDPGEDHAPDPRCGPRPARPSRGPPRGPASGLRERRAAAEDAGFEPARALTQPAFQASAIGH